MTSIKSRIEEHPISILIGVVVVSVTLTTGVNLYFRSEERRISGESLEAQLNHAARTHAHEINTLQSAHDREKDEMNRKIGDLSHRLTSIKRRVGSEDLYLDVSSIPIPHSDLNTLNRHSSYANNEYYIVVPEFQEWEEKKSSLAELAVMVVGDSEIANIAIDDSPAAHILNEKRLTVWLGPTSLTVKLDESFDMFGLGQIEIREHIYAMIVDTEFYGELFDAIYDELFFPEDELEILFRGISSFLDEEDNEERSISEEKAGLSEELQRLYNQDLAGFVLADVVNSGYVTAQAFGAQYSVISAQKKGNILYYRSQTRFADQIDEEGNQTTIYWDQEFFFVAKGNKGVLVRTSIPSYDQISDAYVWTQAWLTSLRVPF